MNRSNDVTMMPALSGIPGTLGGVKHNDYHGHVKAMNDAGWRLVGPIQTCDYYGVPYLVFTWETTP